MYMIREEVKIARVHAFRVRVKVFKVILASSAGAKNYVSQVVYRAVLYSVPNVPFYFHFRFVYRNVISSNFASCLLILELKNACWLRLFLEREMKNKNTVITAYFANMRVLLTHLEQSA